ncbi:MAG: hypothetical protein PHQ54_01165 [Candidatus Omnitrophica bacterium]|nr:hypothetical protein [Candidatus Omnitrophota bacterium]
MNSEDKTDNSPDASKKCSELSSEQGYSCSDGALQESVIFLSMLLKIIPKGLMIFS